MSTHPFAAGSYQLPDGTTRQTYSVSVTCRLGRIPNMTLDQVRAALALPDLQATVRRALKVRQRRLEAGKQ